MAGIDIAPGWSAPAVSPGAATGHIDIAPGWSAPTVSVGSSGLPDVDPGWNGQPLSAGGTSPAQAAAAPAHKGGGGLFGGILHQVGDFASDVKNAPKGIATLGANLVEAPIAVGEKAINTGLQAAGDKSFLLGNENPALNAFARSSDWTSAPQAQAALQALPAIAGTVGGIKTLEGHVAGNAEGLANAPSALLRLTGRVSGDKAAANAPNIAPSGFEKQTIADYKAHPVNAALGDAATLALLAGAGGAAAPEAGAAQAPLEAGVEGPVAPLTAGQQVGGALRGISEGAGKVAMAPLAPYALIPQGVGDVLSRIVPQGIKDSLEARTAGVGLRGAQAEAGVQPADIARETQRMLSSTGANAEEQAAGTLRAQGLAPVLQHLADNPSPVNDIVRNNLLDRLGVPTDMRDQAVVQALTPSAATSAYEGVLRDVSAGAQERALGGFGYKPGAPGLSPEQTVPETRQSVVDRAVEESGLKGLPGEALARRTAAESEAAIPSQYRTPVVAARGVFSDLAAEASKAEAAGGESSDLRQIMSEIEPLTHVESWAGQQAPAFLPGNGTPEGEAQAPAGTSAGRFRQNSATQLRTGISTEYTAKGQTGLQLDDLKEAARNNGTKLVIDRYATSPAQELGQDAVGAVGKTLDAHMQSEGYQAINPNASSKSSFFVDPETVDENTTYVPQALAKAMARQYQEPILEGPAAAIIHGSGKALDFATQHAYRDFLSVSPHFAALRAVGDAFIASIKGGISPSDFFQRYRDASQLVGNGEEPAALARGGLNDTGDVGRVTRTVQAVPRTIDLMTKTMVFLQKAEENGADISDPSSPEYAQAVAEANKAFGGLNALSPAERGVVARVLPAYPWMKSVTESLLGRNGFVANNPAAAALVVNVGRMAAADPNAFKQNALAQEVNPLSIFSIGGGGINPLIRAASGAGLGFNLSTGKEVTHEGTASGPGALTAGQKGYFAANQILPTKLLLNSPAAGILGQPLLGKEWLPGQGIARYQSGQAVVSKGKTEPSYLPPWKTPVGTFGGYVKQVAGVPESPVTNPSGQKAHAKAVTTATKAASTYAKNIARLRAHR